MEAGAIRKFLAKRDDLKLELRKVVPRSCKRWSKTADYWSLMIDLFSHGKSERHYSSYNNYFFQGKNWKEIESCFKELRVAWKDIVRIKTRRCYTLKKVFSYLEVKFFAF